MKYTFVLDSIRNRVQIEGFGRRWIQVAFGTETLEPFAPEPRTRWIVSNQPLRDTRKYPTQVFVHKGKAPWIEPGEMYLGAGYRELEICDLWLQKLFNDIPGTLYFRQTRMK